MDNWPKKKNAPDDKMFFTEEDLERAMKIMQRDRQCFKAQFIPEPPSRVPHGCVVVVVADRRAFEHFCRVMGLTRLDITDGAVVHVRYDDEENSYSIDRRRILLVYVGEAARTGFKYRNNRMHAETLPGPVLWMEDFDGRDHTFGAALAEFAEKRSPGLSPIPKRRKQ